MSNAAFKAKLAKVEALHAAPDAELVPGLRKALSDRSNYIVAKAAAIAGERYATELIPQLLEAYDRLFASDSTVDQLGLGKNAIAKALKDLDHREPAAFLRGLRHVQLEAAWGPKVDAAAALRGTCALALVRCDIDDSMLLRELVEHLATDAEKTVRIDVVRAIADVGGQPSILLLRLKALVGDAEAEIVGECFVALMQREPREALPFVERFFDHHDPEIRFEAVCALAGSRETAAQASVARFWARDNLALDVRRAIIFSCASSAAAEAADFLLSVIADPRPPLGVWALSALGASRFRSDVADRARQAVSQTADPKLLLAWEVAFSTARVNQ